MPKKTEKIKKIDDPFLFGIIIAALVISLSVVAFGIFRNSEDSPVVQTIPKKENSVSDDETELNGLFEKSFEDSETADITDENLRNDPYLRDCSSTAGDDLPAIVDGTVCLR